MSGWRHPLQLTAVTVAAEEDFKVGERVRLMVGRRHPREARGEVSKVITLATLGPRCVDRPAQFEMTAAFEHAVEDSFGEIGIVENACSRTSRGRRPNSFTTFLTRLPLAPSA